MQKISLIRDWCFRLGDPNAEKWVDSQDGSWLTVDLPHDWSIGLERTSDQPGGASNGFFPGGRGWYRKIFTAPLEWQGQKVLVEFEGVYMNAEVWLNENYLGRHPFGYTSFVVDLSPYLRIGESNELRVLVDNAAQPNTRWYSGSGIYRPVWLWVGNRVHIGLWGVAVTTPDVSVDSAQVRVRTQVFNSREPDISSKTQPSIVLVSRVVSSSGSIVADVTSRALIGPNSQNEFSQNIRIEKPALWSPEEPMLYTLESELRVGGELYDTAVTTFGIRSLVFDADQGFLLNGQPWDLKGGCVHHDNGILGAAAYARSEERKVEIHQASGFNAIRTAHNPPSPAFLDACDRLGMFVMEEAFDCWSEGKNPYDYHVVFEDWWQRDIESMVRRDRNHPSVILWSIGNEVMERDGRSGGVKTARRLADVVRKLDNTRPVTAAICGTWDKMRVWEDTDPVFAALDVGGYNYQWQHYQSDHQREPRRIMIGTESFPLEAFDNWMQVIDHSFVIGDFVWTSLDYLGEAGLGRVHYGQEKGGLGVHPWHQANCGDLDLCGFKRPQSYYRDILWGSGAPLYIGVHVPPPPEAAGLTPTITEWGWPEMLASWTWPGQEGQMMKVEVYSVCEKVELFLNGQSLGVQPTTRDERFTATFDVPYQPGTLSASGYTGDELAAESALHTAGQPVKIRLTPDRPVIHCQNQSEGDLCYVTIEVVDAQDRRVPWAAHNVMFDVRGGILLAVGSSNPVSNEPYTGSCRAVYQGRCQVVLKPGYDPAEIVLIARAEGLEDGRIVVQAV